MAEASDHDLDDVVRVTQEGIAVEKRFTTDEFPVPAVKFVLRSETDEPVDVRLTDEIPESFEMESIGFHPEYEGEAWTAYRDHRVEYERTVDPGEEVTTVYGVRIDDTSSGALFLGEPELERVSEATSSADPEEVLGRETTEAVRDALAGEGDLAEESGTDEDVDFDLDDPGDLDLDLDDPADMDVDALGDDLEGVDDVDLDLDDPGSGDAGDLDLDLDEPGGTGEPAGADEGGAVESGNEAAGEADAAEPGAGSGGAPDPRSIDGGLTRAVDPSAPEASAVDEAEPDDGGEYAAATEAGDGVEHEDGSEGAAATEDDHETAAAPGAVPGSVVAALAAEVRDGTADEEDLAALREAIAPEAEPELPRSVEVRIDRLQNRTEDLAAYTDALETFLDEHGTGQEVLDDLDDRTAALRQDLDAVESETAALDETVSEHDDRLEGVETAVDDLTTDVASLDDDLDDLGERVEELAADLDDLAGDAEASVDDLQETLDDVEATMADVEDDIEDLQSFRDRFREAFGT